MKDLTITTLQEYKVIEGDALNLIKGGLSSVTTCDVNACTSNSSSCMKNYCNGNSQYCNENSCTNNYYTPPCDPNTKPCNPNKIDTCNSYGTGCTRVVNS